MKVLVTGATGFIGNYVILELLKNTNIEVIATSRTEDKASDFEWYNKVKHIEYDIKDTKVNLFKYFEEPDILIHLLWEGLPNYKALFHIEENLFNHYRFINNLISNGLNDINAIGTCLEYGLQNGSLNEKMCTNPTTAYGVAKDSLRKFLEVLNVDDKFNLKWIRLFYTYGEGQNTSSLLAQLKTAVEKKEKQFKMSGGEQIRDFSDVKNIAKNIVKISLQSYVTGIINCCSGQPISVRRFVENYLKENNLINKIELNLGVYMYPDYEPFSFWGNRDKLDLIIEGKLE